MALRPSQCTATVTWSLGMIIWAIYLRLSCLAQRWYLFRSWSKFTKTTFGSERIFHVHARVEVLCSVFWHRYLVKYGQFQEFCSTRLNLAAQVDLFLEGILEISAYQSRLKGFLISIHLQSVKDHPKFIFFTTVGQHGQHVSLPFEERFMNIWWPFTPWRWIEIKKPLKRLW